MEICRLQHPNNILCINIETVQHAGIIVTTPAVLYGHTPGRGRMEKKQHLGLLKMKDRHTIKQIMCCAGL